MSGQTTHGSVGQVSGQDSREAVTDEIAKVAESLPAALEDTGQSTTFVGVTEGHNSNDPLLYCSGEAVGSNVGDLSTLTVVQVN